MKRIILLLLALAPFSVLNAQDVTALYQKALDFHKKWNYDSTMHYMHLAKQAAPEMHILNYYEARFLGDFSRYHEAIAQYAELMKHRSEFDVRIQRAMIEDYADCYLMLDSTAHGFKILEDALATDKYNTSLLTSTAHLYFSSGNMAKSREYLARAYDLDSTDSWVVYFIGEVSRHLDDTATENLYFDKTLAMEKEQKVTYLTPFVYCFTRTPKEAVKSMKSAVKDDSRAFPNLVAVYGILGMKKECIAGFKKMMNTRELDSYYYWSHSKDYESVRNEPEYQALMNELREK